MPLAKLDRYARKPTPNRMALAEPRLTGEPVVARDGKDALDSLSQRAAYDAREGGNLWSQSTAGGELRRAEMARAPSPSALAS